MPRLRPTSRQLLPVLVTAILLWLVAGPNLRLAVGSLIDDSGPRPVFTLAGWHELFVGPGHGLSNIEFEALGNSLLISVLSVLLSAGIGVPLAFLVTRYDFPGRRVIAGLAVVPILLPPLVGTMAFYFLYAPSGIVTRLVQSALGLSHAPWTFRGMGAVLAVHAYSFYAYFYTFVAAGLQRLDESRLEAAGTLGAGRSRVFWTVTLPLLTPSLLGASLLCFMQSMASFTAPYVLGGVRVLTTQLLASRQRSSLTLMRAETVVLAAVCVLFLLLLRWVESRGNYYGGGKGGAGRRRMVRSGGTRLVLGLLGAVAVVVLLLPHAMLLLLSFADDAAWTTQILPPRYTLDAFRFIAAQPDGQIPLINSLAMATQATVANVLFALVAAWCFARVRFRGRGLAEALAVLPYAIPGTVTALALAEWFSVNQPWAGRFLLLSTYTILPLAYFVRSIPLTVRAVGSSFAQVDPSIEEAAGTLGARPGRVFGTVVLPLVAPGAIVGGLLAFIAAMGEFVASIVLYTPANRPVSIEIANQFRGSYFARGAAYGVILVVVTAAVLALAPLLGRRRELPLA
ncbi:MAG: iron ABC transporter permease [Armatimonadetes bacterium]|nr:iron ABC transporter permease [Armatimonadota bacterium]